MSATEWFLLGIDINTALIAMAVLVGRSGHRQRGESR